MRKERNDGTYDEKELTGRELLDYFSSNGILQEINRTFLHPIGLEMSFDLKEDSIRIYKTDDPKGYVLDRINPFLSKQFRKFSMDKQTERNNLLGFGIQIDNLYRSENLKTGGLMVAPERKKIESITRYFILFVNEMHKQFIDNHQAKDHILIPQQFDSEYLDTKLQDNINEKNYIDAANTLCLIKYSKELMEDMNTIIKYKEDYNIKMDEYKKSLEPSQESIDESGPKEAKK